MGNCRVKMETKIEERYLRVIGTGEIVKWKGFSEITQVYEVGIAGRKGFYGSKQPGVAAGDGRGGESV